MISNEATTILTQRVTDQRKEGKKHLFYPFVSNPADGMFPSSSEKLLRISYVFIVIGFLVFILQLSLEVVESSVSFYLFDIGGVLIVIGTIIFVGSKIKASRHK